MTVKVGRFVNRPYGWGRLDDVEIASSEHIAWERLGSHAQVTDAHLLALALQRGGRLATFDRALSDLAPEGAAEKVHLLDGG